MDVTIPCICPDKTHDEDTVSLRERLDFLGASSVRNAAVVLKASDPGANTAQVMAVMTEAYILAGIEGWTVRNGKPIEPTAPAIRQYLLPNVDAAMTVGEAADELYGEVMRPLVLRAFKPSPTSPTVESTSPTNGSPPTLPKPSKRSSTSTTPTDSTEATSPSPDGDSSSSRNSASAA